MNLASWLVLAIVVAILGLAIRAAFGKGGKSGCHDCGSCGHTDDCPHCRK